MSSNSTETAICKGPQDIEVIVGGDSGNSTQIFHALMPFKVREILLVSSLYDAFVIEEEGLIPELLIGEYRHFHLSSPPRVTRVSSGTGALEKAMEKPYDLVITMSKNIGMDPYEFGRGVKKICKELPVVLLATDAGDLEICQKRDEAGNRDCIDKVFYWNGDSELFLAIIKYVEDGVNAVFDTVNGNVRVIIMVEDSVRYYSMFLPIIYEEIVRQTRKLLTEDLNEMQRLLRRKARPKILLAETFEEGMALYEKYRDYILGIISDVNYKNRSDDEKSNPDAGYEFIRTIKEKEGHIPTLIQSSGLKNKERAESLGSYFLHKPSPTLLQDFRHFLLEHLGFGDFIFLVPTGKSAKDEGENGKDGSGKGKDEVENGKDEVENGKDGSGKGKDEVENGKDEVENGKDGSGKGKDEVENEKNLKKPGDALHDYTRKVGWASSMVEFEKMLREVPLESIKFHADRNNFSNWLMARGEFKLAEKLRPRKASDFTDLGEVREFLVKLFKDARREKQMGVITDFHQQEFEFESSFTRLGGGSLGGKGRGIAFIRSLLAHSGIRSGSTKHQNIDISVPSTVVVGTDEFDSFMTDNDLRKPLEQKEMSDGEIARLFLQSRLSENLKNDLRILLEFFGSPLAVRSSSLLEDSQNHPFAGIYSTYMLPNNNEDPEVCLKHLCQAIKLVYSSVFYRDARVYIEATASKPEEEKMAIVIQKVVGRDYGGRFYPDFSGIAQSYNYYPVTRQKPEEGIVSVAAGLGKMVVGGERVLRFSPRYPHMIPDFSTPEQILANSQKKLYVLNTSLKDFELSERDDVTLSRIEIHEIEKDGTLEHIASTYDSNDGVIRDSIYFDGPRLVTFAGVLKYEAFPLAPVIQDILELGRKGMGSPVELEFAVNIEKENNVQNNIQNNTPSKFSILQIRPLVTMLEHCEIALDGSVERDKVFLQSEMALGNGVVENVRDIVYVPPDKFDSSHTLEMAGEVERFNRKLVDSSRPYMLIGPGRWGTQDRWLGIPVTWSQISGVRLITETAMENFNIKPSQGTHFLQNITSRRIGYVTIPYNSGNSFIDWEWLEEQETVEKLKFMKHVTLSSPLEIRVDGRCGGAQILKPGVREI